MRLVLLFILIISFEARADIILSGYGISMTRETLENDEVLKNVKKFKLKKCYEFYKKVPGIADDIVLFAQTKLNADFIRNFTIRNEGSSLFKTCYSLEGIASRAVKVKRSKPNLGYGK